MSKKNDKKNEKKLYTEERTLIAIAKRLNILQTRLNAQKMLKRVKKVLFLLPYILFN